MFLMRADYIIKRESERERETTKTYLDSIAINGHSDNGGVSTLKCFHPKFKSFQIK